MPNRDELPDGEVQRFRANRYLAYSYTRVSTPRQDWDGGIENQIARIAEWAEESYIIADRFYADRARHVWNGNPLDPVDDQVALRQLQDDFLRETNPRKMLVATSVSRFSRDRHLGDLFFQWVMKHDFKIFIIDDGWYLPTEEHRSTWFDKCVEAEEQSALRSRNAYAQQEQRRVRGEQTATYRWGFDRVDGGLRLNRQKGEVVRGLYELVWKGAKINDLIAYLDNSGQWRPRKPSREKTSKKVHDLLHEPVFAGLQLLPRLNGHWRLAPVDSGSVVSYEEYFQMQLIWAKRVSRHDSFFYLLDKVNCEVCRKPLRAARVDYRKFDGEEAKFVSAAYVCRTSGCRPARVYDADLMHLTLKMRLQEHEYRSGDKGFYTRWMNASRTEQRSMLRDNFHFNFIATQDGVEWPSRLRNPA